MKKTSCIHLALITAALASCTRPAYWRNPENTESADSTESPMEDSCFYDSRVDLWRYSFQDFLDDYFYYYPTEYCHGSLPSTTGTTKFIHRPAIVRGGFGRTLAVVA